MGRAESTCQMGRATGQIIPVERDTVDPGTALFTSIYTCVDGSSGVKIVSITDVRQDATRLVDHAHEAGEPVLVLQRSKPAVYLVGAAQYEAMAAELKRLQHALFWQDVAAAEAEHRAGRGRVYDDVERLIADLGLEVEGDEATAPAASR